MALQGNQLNRLENPATEINKNQPNDMNDLNSISIRRPAFPPTIDIDSMVTRLLRRTNPKMPNEFFIYRAALVKELKENKYKIKMTKLSSLAADSWSQEPPSIKAVYRKLSRETERKYLSNRALARCNLNPKYDSKNGPKGGVVMPTQTPTPSPSPLPPQIIPQPTFDFPLMDCMKPGYDQNPLYLTQPQEQIYYNSSENSSPITPLISSPPSLNSTNINESNDNLPEQFFAPVYQLGYGMSHLTISDISDICNINDLSFYDNNNNNNTY